MQLSAPEPVRQGLIYAAFIKTCGRAPTVGNLTFAHVTSTFSSDLTLSMKLTGDQSVCAAKKSGSLTRHRDSAGFLTLISTQNEPGGNR
jgi:hypothetical protein